MPNKKLNQSNQRKLCRWKMEECCKHGQKHEDCPCQPTRRLPGFDHRKKYIVHAWEKDQIYLFKCNYHLLNTILEEKI